MSPLYDWAGLDNEVRKQLCALADYPTWRAELHDWSDMEIDAILTLGKMGMRGTEDYFFQYPVDEGKIHKTVDLLFWREVPQLVVELYGCWVHQCPLCHPRELLLGIRKKDDQRVAFLLAKGYRVFVVWRHEKLE